MGVSGSRILGVAVLAFGAVLLVFAYNASNAPMDQVANSLTGRYTDQTMWYLLTGVVAAIVGGFLALSGRSAS